VQKDEDALTFIKNYHKNETGHMGINEKYMSLRRLIYTPKLKQLIHVIETPKDLNQIIHTNSKSQFLTLIDRFSKFTTADYLPNENRRTIVEFLRLYKSQKGRIKTLICDNEFKSISSKTKKSTYTWCSLIITLGMKISRDSTTQLLKNKEY